MVVTKSRTAKIQPNNSSFMTFGNTTFRNLMHTITNVIKKLYKKVVVTKSHTVNTSEKLCYENLLTIVTYIERELSKSCFLTKITPV